MAIPSEKMSQTLLTVYGNLDLFLAVAKSHRPRIPAGWLPRVAELLHRRSVNLELRVAASRAALDLLQPAQIDRRIPSFMSLLEHLDEDERIRMNCALILLHQPGCHRPRILEVLCQGEFRMSWTAALLKALLACNQDPPASAADSQPLLSIAETGTDEERAAALFLAQWQPWSERALELAHSLCGSSHSRLRIAAARLAMIYSVQKVHDIGLLLARSVSPLVDDPEAAVRAVLPDLTVLFQAHSDTVKRLVQRLETDPDDRVKKLMQHRLDEARPMEFPA